ncbi:hypothetical protein FRC03_006915, partial [Tulasnella sp. 419]
TGATVGGTFIGYVSQSFGRRRSIVLAALLAGCLIPAWILPTSEGGLSAGSFFLQFFVQGAWGVIPVHLNELSPPAFRASFPGVAYQIGNMISSPAAEMVTGISGRIHIAGPNGKRVEAFGPVMGVSTAIIATGLAIWTAIGHEQRGSHFEHEVAGVGHVGEDGPSHGDEIKPSGASATRSSSDVEKGDMKEIEAHNAQTSHAAK